MEKEEIMERRKKPQWMERKRIAERMREKTDHRKNGKNDPIWNGRGRTSSGWREDGSQKE